MGPPRIRKLSRNKYFIPWKKIMLLQNYEVINTIIIILIYFNYSCYYYFVGTKGTKYKPKLGYKSKMYIVKPKNHAISNLTVAYKSNIEKEN